MSAGGQGFFQMPMRLRKKGDPGRPLSGTGPGHALANDRLVLARAPSRRVSAVQGPAQFDDHLPEFVYLLAEFAYLIAHSPHLLLQISRLLGRPLGSPSGSGPLAGTLRWPPGTFTTPSGTFTSWATGLRGCRTLRQMLFRSACGPARPRGRFGPALRFRTLRSLPHLSRTVTGTAAEGLTGLFPLSHQFAEFPLQALSLLRGPGGGVFLAFVPEFTGLGVEPTDLGPQFLPPLEVLSRLLGELLDAVGLLTQPLGRVLLAFGLQPLSPLTHPVRCLRPTPTSGTGLRALPDVPPAPALAGTPFSPGPRAFASAGLRTLAEFAFQVGGLFSKCLGVFEVSLDLQPFGLGQ